ncbi:hypothetical protein J6590_015794 [Homalodisca vitripennis]|nr:hypothetical protein J6590_015794 [Homalodisca vitripennis]
MQCLGPDTAVTDLTQDFGVHIHLKGPNITMPRRNLARVLSFLHHGYPSRPMFHLNEYLRS